ncbi:hypothetical protein NHP190012_04980 [Helicobacter sp. NHP19-012]|uniref:beta-lactamase n=1 Tax=Helicobacter gastrofelis TaxID=2849642 RepID=A0ABN6I5G9_9HELI|nr:hypothetical protein [Helicobacter sp. NHP19-012]BCZ18856.1 hypothetical protein NHP190012_04980 [Helicobacter sp. NHP19-012]
MGDARGYSELGDLYHEGKGVSKDYSKGLELLQKSADMGNADSYIALGAAYEHGFGVKKDGRWHNNTIKKLAIWESKKAVKMPRGWANK